MIVPALAIRQLSYRYRAGFDLRGIDFSVAPGEFCVLLGPNGAGKTTLVCLLTRLFTPGEGDIVIDGRSLLSEPGAALARLGVVFQQSSIDLDLTVAENMRYAAALHGLTGGEAAARITAELERLGLAERAREPVRRLSGGFRRRLELARALLHRPKLLICDEATVGLDLPTRRALVAHLRHLCAEEGMAVLWTTHLIEEVAETDPVVVMLLGRMRSRGRASDLMRGTDTPSLEAAFAALTGGVAA